MNELRELVAEYLAVHIGYHGLIALPKEQREKFHLEADQILTLVYEEAKRQGWYKQGVETVYNSNQEPKIEQYFVPVSKSDLGLKEV